MTNDATQDAAGETLAGTKPNSGTPTRRQNPPMRRVAPALPEPLTALDFAQRMQDIGLHWWALIDGIFEQLHTDKAKAAPVPEWALEWLKDQGRHDLTHEEMRSQGEALRDLLRLQEGRPARTVFEVWGDRATRLSIGHECVADAMPTLDSFKASGKYPQAAIVRVSRLGGAWSSDPALLDTLVGRVHLAGSSVGLTNDDGFFSIQDETGRQLLLTPDQIAGHKVLERMSSEDCASIDAWIEYLAERKALRAAARDGQQ
ncbi:hypothetical protein [Simplicispira piscis]